MTAETRAPSERPWCAEQVYHGRGGMAHCSRRGTVWGTKCWPGGKKTGWWCKQHSPEAEAERKLAWEKKFNAERARESRHWARKGAEAALMEWAREAGLQLPEEGRKIVERYEKNLEPTT